MRNRGRDTGAGSVLVRLAIISLLACSVAPSLVATHALDGQIYAIPDFPTNRFGHEVHERFNALLVADDSKAVEDLWSLYSQANGCVGPWAPPGFFTSSPPLAVPYQSRKNPAFPVVVSPIGNALRAKMVSILYSTGEYDPSDLLNLQLYDAWRMWPAKDKLDASYPLFNILARAGTPVCASIVSAEITGRFRAYAWDSLGDFDPEYVSINFSQILNEGDAQTCVQAASALERWGRPEDRRWAILLSAKVAWDPDLRRLALARISRMSVREKAK